MGSYRKSRVVSLNGLGFDVFIFDDGMVRIGCEIFHISERLNFPDHLLASMDAYALDFRNNGVGDFLALLMRPH